MELPYMLFNNSGQMPAKKFAEKREEMKWKEVRLHIAASEGMAVSLNVFLQSLF
jgi:hypothetical protein